MEYTIEHIDRALKSIDCLMPAKLNKQSIRKCSLKETIFMMAPTLFKKREMGASTKELVKWLADEGIVINEQTLNRYLLAYVEMQGGESVAKPKRTVNKKKQNHGIDVAGTIDNLKPEKSKVQADLDENYEPYELKESADESEREVVDD